MTLFNTIPISRKSYLFFVSLVGKRERERGYTDEAKQLEENVEDEETNNLAENAEKTPLYVLTLYTLTSICIFSILFFLHISYGLVKENLPSRTSDWVVISFSLVVTTNFT